MRCFFSFDTALQTFQVSSQVWCVPTSSLLLNRNTKSAPRSLQRHDSKPAWRMKTTFLICLTFKRVQFFIWSQLNSFRTLFLQPHLEKRWTYLLSTRRNLTPPPTTKKTNNKNNLVLYHPVTEVYPIQEGFKPPLEKETLRQLCVLAADIEHQGCCIFPLLPTKAFGWFTCTPPPSGAFQMIFFKWTAILPHGVKPLRQLFQTGLPGIKHTCAFSKTMRK